MVIRVPNSEEYELLPRTSLDSSRSFTDSGDKKHSLSSFSRYLRVPVWLRVRLSSRPSRVFYSKISSSRRPWRLLTCPITSILLAIFCITILLVAFTAALRPSYTHLPDHYKALQRRCQESKSPGRGNAKNEKIFIAATLYDAEGALVGGDWGRAVSELVDLLGPDNVYLSVYENDADTRAKASLEHLAQSLSCKPLYPSPI